MIGLASRKREVQQVWEEYIALPSDQLREELLIHYLPLVRVVAGRMKVGLPGSVEYDDLVSNGLIGLMNSIDHFSPERGFKFETYAVPRIRGAILDGLRDVDWLPRSVRQKSRQLDQTVEKLTIQLGRSPQEHEIAAELGLEGEDYNRFMEQAGAGSMLSLDVKFSEGDDEEGGSLHEIIPDPDSTNPLLDLENKDAKEIAKKLIARLSEQDRAVVALYYYEELTFKEIGQVLGVSESRICQFIPACSRPFARN
jgi:RNA polymerase sigma factor for flagellar operon FliA